jgi:thymidine kinase
MSIKIILGCMYSGKTSEVIRECKKWQSVGGNALCINFIGDDRYGSDGQAYSHDLNSVKCVKVNELSEINVNTVLASDLILINEAQFFGDLVEYCLIWCENYDKKIIVSGLDGDYQRKPFGKILDLIPYADSVIKLNAYCSICKDGTLAPFSKRFTAEKEQILIGSDIYGAVCRKHFLDETRHVQMLIN